MSETGGTALRPIAEAADAAWGRVVVAARALPPSTTGPARDAVVSVLGVIGPELAEVASRPAAPAVVEFAERFVADVASVRADQRAAALAVLGGEALAFVQALYVADLGARRARAFVALFGGDTDTPPVGGAADLWTELESYLASVACMDTLDPVTTELVRLRGANAHGCRLCQSIRSAPAQRLGADEMFYAGLGRPLSESGFPARERAAIALVDAMLWTPGAIPRPVAEAVRAQFTDAQAVELVHDVVRNAANKIAVAFGADEPHVSEGLELYDVDPDGRLRYGADVPGVG